MAPVRGTGLRADSSIVGSRRGRVVALIGVVATAAGVVWLAGRAVGGNAASEAQWVPALGLVGLLLLVLYLGTRWWIRHLTPTRVDLQRAQGVQVGHQNVQNIHFYAPPGSRSPLEMAADRLAGAMRATWLGQLKARQISTPAPARVR